MFILHILMIFFSIVGCHKSSDRINPSGHISKQNQAPDSFDDDGYAHDEEDIDHESESSKIGKKSIPTPSSQESGDADESPSEDFDPSLNFKGQRQGDSSHSRKYPTEKNGDKKSESPKESAKENEGKEVPAKPEASESAKPQAVPVERETQASTNRSFTTSTEGTGFSIGFMKDTDMGKTDVELQNNAATFKIFQRYLANLVIRKIGLDDFGQTKGDLEKLYREYNQTVPQQSMSWATISPSLDAYCKEDFDARSLKQNYLKSIKDVLKSKPKAKISVIPWYNLSYIFDNYGEQTLTLQSNSVMYPNLTCSHVRDGGAATFALLSVLFPVQCPSHINPKFDKQQRAQDVAQLFKDIILDLVPEQQERVFFSERAMDFKPQADEMSLDCLNLNKRGLARFEKENWDDIDQHFEVL